MVSALINLVLYLYLLNISSIWVLEFWFSLYKSWHCCEIVAAHGLTLGTTVISSKHFFRSYLIFLINLFVSFNLKL